MPSIEASNLFSVKDMVFVITGAGSGIGAMMAHALDVNGASKVYILGRREANLNKVAAAAKNKSIFPIVCDASSKDSLAAAAAEVAKHSPFVNVVVANAGIIGPTESLNAPWTKDTPSLSQLQQYLWRTSLEDANSFSELNVIGSYFTFIAFLPLLEAGNSHPDSPGKSGYLKSQFITTSSVAAFSRRNLVGYPYHTSKAALTHLTKMLSTDFANYGIRANAFCPGFIKTETTEAAMEAKEGTSFDITVPGSTPKEINPAMRAGSDEDVAGAILFLVSRAGSFVNGTVLVVDGGQLSVLASSY